MAISWALFFATTVVAYIGISWFAQLSGDSGGTALRAFLSAVRPFPLLVVTIANMFFGLALYLGFSVTRFAIPAAVATGVVTSFVYSAIVLGAQVTLTKIVGVAIIVVGVIVLVL